MSIPLGSPRVTGWPTSTLCRKWKRSKVWLIQWRQNFGFSFWLIQTLCAIPTLYNWVHRLPYTDFWIKSVPSTTVAWGVPLGLNKQVKWLCYIRGKYAEPLCSLYFQNGKGSGASGFLPHFTNKDTEQFKSGVEYSLSVAEPCLNHSAWIYQPANLRTSKCFTLSHSLSIETELDLVV